MQDWHLSVMTVNRTSIYFPYSLLSMRRLPGTMQRYYVQQGRYTKHQSRKEGIKAQEVSV